MADWSSWKSIDPTVQDPSTYWNWRNEFHTLCIPHDYTLGGTRYFNNTYYFGIYYRRKYENNKNYFQFYIAMNANENDGENQNYKLGLLLNSIAGVVGGPNGADSQYSIEFPYALLISKYTFEERDISYNDGYWDDLYSFPTDDPWTDPPYGAYDNLYAEYIDSDGYAYFAFEFKNTAIDDESWLVGNYRIIIKVPIEPSGANAYVDTSSDIEIDDTTHKISILGGTSSQELSGGHVDVKYLIRSHTGLVSGGPYNLADIDMNTIIENRNRYDVDLKYSTDWMDEFENDYDDIVIKFISRTYDKNNNLYSTNEFEHRAYLPKYNKYDPPTGRMSLTHVKDFMNSDPLHGNLPWPFGVKNFTNVDIEIDTSEIGMYGAHMKYYYIFHKIVDGVEIDDQKQEGHDQNRIRITSSGTYKIYISVTDYRIFTRYGNNSIEESITYLGTIDVLDISSPKIISANAIRCDSDGTPSETGTYTKININQEYSTLEYDGVIYNSINNTYMAKININRGDIPVFIPLTNQPQQYTYERQEDQQTITEEFKPEYSYSFVCRSTDRFDLYGDYSDISISVAHATFHLIRGGHGIGIGRYANATETTPSVQSAWEIAATAFKLIDDMPEMHVPFAGHFLCPVVWGVDTKDPTPTLLNPLAPLYETFIKIKTPGRYIFFGLSSIPIGTDPNTLDQGPKWREEEKSNDYNGIFNSKVFGFTENNQLGGLYYSKTGGIAVLDIVSGTVNIRFGCTKESTESRYEDFRNEYSMIIGINIGDRLSERDLHDNGL